MTNANSATVDQPMNHKLVQCSRCVLPGNYPGINFDADGVCNFCRFHRKLEYLGEQALRERFAATPRNHNSCDCVVPVSGGKDSTFVLYYLTSVLGLKAIAVNYDNGLAHPQAKENLLRLTTGLGVELVTMKGFKQRKLLAGNLKAYLARPTPAMVPMICTGCRLGIVGSACKVARERGVRIIVMGWSAIEDTPFKTAFLKAQGSSTTMGLAVNVALNPRYLLYGSVVTQVMDYFHTYSRVREWGPILRLLHPQISQIAFYDFIEYNPDRIQKELTEKIGWSAPVQENSWQFDCRIKSLQNILYASAVGFTASNDYLSSNIREGHIRREQALRSLERQRQERDAGVQQVLTLLHDIEADDLIPRIKSLISSLNCSSTTMR